MVNYVQMNTDMLQRDILEIETNINGIDEDIEAIYSEVKALNSMWSGVANEVFNARFNEDHETVSKITESLKEFKNLLEEAKGKYIKCETTVYDRVKGL